jgi:hypothetical protein
MYLYIHIHIYTGVSRLSTTSSDRIDTHIRIKTPDPDIRMKTSDTDIRVKTPELFPSPSPSKKHPNLMQTFSMRDLKAGGKL